MVRCCHLHRRTRKHSQSSTVSMWSIGCFGQSSSFLSMETSTALWALQVPIWMNYIASLGTRLICEHIFYLPSRMRLAPVPFRQISSSRWGIFNNGDDCRWCVFADGVNLNVALYMDPYAPLCYWYLPMELIERLYLSPVFRPARKPGGESLVVRRWCTKWFLVS